MKYKYLLFDLDGTLVDTLPGVVNCARYALSFFGIDADTKELTPFFGPPLKDSFMNMFGFSEAQADKAILKYRERYDKLGIDESRLFDEIPSLLDDLTKVGYRLCVATSKYEVTADVLLEKLGIADKFEFITGADLHETRASKYEIIEESLKRFGISDDRSLALMIGDMKYDDIGARKARIDSFGIYTGAASEGEHEEAGATYTAHSFAELRERLLSFV